MLSEWRFIFITPQNSSQIVHRLKHKETFNVTIVLFKRKKKILKKVKLNDVKKIIQPTVEITLKYL